MEACLLCRVPIYGFYLRMDSNAKTAGMKVSKGDACVAFGLLVYFHQHGNRALDAMLCTHVDEVSFAHKPSAAKVTEDIFSNRSACPSPHYHLCRPCVGPAPIPTQPHAPARSLTPPFAQHTPTQSDSEHNTAEKKSRRKKNRRGNLQALWPTFPPSIRI